MWCPVLKHDFSGKYRVVDLHRNKKQWSAHRDQVPTFVPEDKVSTLYLSIGTMPKFKHEYLKKRVGSHYCPVTTVYELQVWMLPNRTHLQDQHLPERTPGVLVPA